jgi:hypothetical protein
MDDFARAPLYGYRCHVIAVIESVMSQVEANHAARWAEAVAMTSVAEPPQVGRIGGSRTPARKHVPDSTNKMPVAR